MAVSVAIPLINEHVENTTPYHIRVQQHGLQGLPGRLWPVLVHLSGSLLVYQMLAVYLTNLSATAFLNVHLANLKLYIMLFKDHGFLCDNGCIITLLKMWPFATRVTAIKLGKMKVSGNVKDSLFIYGGFSNWNDATRLFNSHESSVTHKMLFKLLSPYPGQQEMWEKCSALLLLFKSV